nr:hypothetical protein 4 [Rhodospirillaceae bacterium]
MQNSELDALIEPVARALLGEPNARASNGSTLRWGTHGSLAVTISGDKAGTWFDHENNEGGGTIDLVTRGTGLKDREAVAWIEENIPGASRSSSGTKTKRRIVAKYDYLDEGGTLLSQVVRYRPKEFRQRRPDGKDGWIWNVKGVRSVPYRLPDILEGSAVVIVEGEKDADLLANHEILATCNAGGAGKWKPEFAQYFRGTTVYIVPDNDSAGRKHARQVAASLHGVAASVRVCPIPADDGLPTNGDISDWLDAGNDPATLLDRCAAYPEWEPGDGAEEAAEEPEPPNDNPRRRLRPILLAEKNDLPDRDMIIKGLLGLGELSVVYGPPKCGKTFLALHTALCVARGTPWFDRRTKPGLVVYIAAEGQRGIEKRLDAYFQHYGVDRVDIPFARITDAPDMRSSTADTDTLTEEINALASTLDKPAALIVVDTLKRCLGGGNENGPEDMGAFIAHCERLQRETGAHVMVVHHEGKDKSRGGMGHTSLFGAVDAIVRVEKLETCKVATLEAAKDDEDGWKVVFDLPQVTVGEDEDGEPITTCVVVPAEEDAPVSSHKPLKGDKRLLHESLLHVLATAGEQVSQPHIPTGVLCVPLDLLRAEFYARKDGNNETKRKAFNRSLSDLRDLGRIAHRDPYVWSPDRDKTAM